MHDLLRARVRLFLVTAGVSLGITVAGGASAQAPVPASTAATGDYVERRTDDGASVVFKDNLLAGDALGPSGMVVTSGPRVARMGLIRPRFHFVSELLKSVEAL